MNKKIITLFFGILILGGCGTENSEEILNKDNQIKIKDKENGIELTVVLDKTSYGSMDKVKIDVTAKNISGKDIKYTANNGCFNGFSYDSSKGMGRLYDGTKDGSSGQMCTMAIEKRVFEKKTIKKMKLEFQPKEIIDDRYLYTGEKLELGVDFLGTGTNIPLPIEIEIKERREGIPSSAEEAAELHLNNKVLKEWMEKDPLNRKQLAIASVSDSGSVWLIEYTTNGPNSSRMKLKIESDTGKVIGATRYHWDEEEVIIPEMVLRTSFENDLKKNPNKLYKVTIHSNDFRKKIYNEDTKEDESEKNKKHIKIIESHNGKVIDYSKWVYTYTIEIKGKDVLEMAKSEEWEYIKPGGMFE